MIITADAIDALNHAAEQRRIRVGRLGKVKWGRLNTEQINAAYEVVFGEG